MEVNQLKAESWDLHKQIGGYLRYLRSRLDKDPSRVNESPDNLYADDFASDLFNHSTIQHFNA